MKPESVTKDREITEDGLREVLRTDALGRRVFAFGRCESTNVLARRLLEANPVPPHGAVVTAEFQTAGRGRNGHVWTAPSGSSLLFSVILDSTLLAPVWRGEDASRLTMAAAVAVVSGLGRAGAPGCAIKWPNDVLTGEGRKICGILIERTGRFLIAGIGINVNQREMDFPEEIRGSSSSVRLLAERAVDRLGLLGIVLEEFENSIGSDPEDLFRLWLRRCHTLGRYVRVRIAGRAVSGQVVGFEPDGTLILRHPSGPLERVHSGDVEELRTHAKQ